MSKVLRRSVVYTLVSGICIFLSSNTSAQVIANDFDSDGLSDFAIVSIGSDKALNWSVVQSTTNSASSLGNLGVSGDHIIMAPWKGSGKSQIGVVSVNSDNKLVWKIKNDEGQTEEREFGKSNYTALSGGDFDGDGKADAAVAVLKKNTNVQWQISYGTFTSLVGQEKISKLNFGTAGDRIFFASPDGKSDWLGTVGKGLKGKGVQLRLKSLITGEVKSSAKFPSYIVKGSRPRPFPLKQADNTDLLVFARVVKGNTSIDVRNVSGEQVASVELPGKGDVVVGNFTSDAGEEIAIKTSSGYKVYSVISKLVTDVVSSEGVAVDEVNINNFSSSSSSNSGNSGNNGGSDNNGGSAPPASGEGCSSIVSWPSSHIYKTVGSHHFSDVRRNTSGIVVKSGGRPPFPGCVNIQDTKGNVLAKMGSYPPGPGWSARYYAGISCGASTPFNGAKIASMAKANTGSTYIYANFGSVCYGPIDATKCLGSSSC